jgi:type IV secretory pathway TraG/TraD family ATPase VirD4
MFDELGALHRLPAIENGLQTARAFGGAMILGIHSFEKLIEVYGEQGARNLASLARSKLILATADLDTAEQCARTSATAKCGRWMRPIATATTTIATPRR